MRERKENRLNKKDKYTIEFILYYIIFIYIRFFFYKRYLTIYDNKSKRKWEKGGAYLKNKRV